MVDKPNYKKDLTPEQYEVCCSKGTEPQFSGKSTTAARIRASTSVSAMAITYLPTTPNPILAPAGPAFGL